MSEGNSLLPSPQSDNQDLVVLTADIVSAYVSNNNISPGDVSQLIADVHAALSNVAVPVSAARQETLKPAVPPKKSVFDDFIICLEDGKKFKSLRRHLRSQYNLTPEEYREKWGLPPDYPMVAPSYAKARSRLAKQMGLGQQRANRT